MFLKFAKRESKYPKYRSTGWSQGVRCDSEVPGLQSSNEGCEPVTFFEKNIARRGAEECTKT